MNMYDVNYYLDNGDAFYNGKVMYCKKSINKYKKIKVQKKYQ